MSIAIAGTMEIGRAEARGINLPVDIAADGRLLSWQWAKADGAGDVEVTAGSAVISSSLVEQSLGELTVSNDGNDRVVTVPAGKLIRYLALSGLKTDGDVRVRSQGELSGAGRRLAITLETGGSVPAPQYAIPPVGARGMIPTTLTGASYENDVLELPDVAAKRIRLSLVEGDVPESFGKHAMTLEGVTGTAAVLPRNLRLIEPDGATIVWQFPGDMPVAAPEFTVDLATSAGKLLRQALKSGGPTDFAYRLKADEAAAVYLRFIKPSGALLRVFSGTLEHELVGDPVTLSLGVPPLAPELPSAVTGDLTVTYRGLRLLESLSSDLPEAAGAVAGVIVGEEPVVRPFPPQAFEALPPARIGIIGRSPVDCELSIQLTAVNGPAVAPPGVTQLPPSLTMGTVWIDLPPIEAAGQPLALTVRATKGRFLWAAGDQPLVRVAVRDPDPGGRTLTLNGAVLTAVTAKKTVVKAASLSRTAFRAVAPTLASTLFLKVDVSDLVVRYGR